MTLIENINPIWVDKEKLFFDMLHDLSAKSVIGIDTESNSLFAYYEKVCLIQISTLNSDYIVDPLSIKNISGLGDIFRDVNIQKIFHAAEYDIMTLKRDFQFEFNNIFDTMVASRILGKKAFGLSNLLLNYFSIKVDKKFQTANWGKRPLTPEMLSYAIVDSHYLIALRNQIKEELTQAELLPLAEEDFIRTSNVEAFTNNQNGNNYWRYLKGEHLSPQEMAVFINLCDFRECMAKNANLPVFKIFSSRLLYEIAKISPTDLQQLGNIKGFSTKLSLKYGAQILEEVNKGLKNKPVYKPHKTKPDEQYLHIYESLKLWRKKIASTYNVESDVILPKEFIEKIASNLPKDISCLKDVMKDIPYRFNHFGETIMRVIDLAERI